MESFQTAHQLEYLRITYPIVLLLVFFGASIAESVKAAKKAKENDREMQRGPNGKPLPKRLRIQTCAVQSARHKYPRREKNVFAYFTTCVLATLVADGAIHIAHVIVARSEKWWCGQAVVIYVVLSFFSHTVVFISLLNSGSGPTFAQFISWVVAAAFELAILATSLRIFVHPHRESVVGDPFGGPIRKHITQWEYAEVVSVSIRALILALLVTLYILHSASTTANDHQPTKANEATETTRLLNPSRVIVESNEHSVIDGQNHPEPWTRPTTTPSTSLWEYVSGYRLFFPYLWPSKSRRLQIVFIICIGLLILQRIVNVLAPYQAGVITDTLSWKEGQLQVPWIQICLYIIYRWLQGSQGLIDSVRSNLWISITQYSYMELSTAAFEHVHNLSLDFHLGKKIGEVLSALTKGSSINTFLEQITFQVLPTLIDLGIAIAYFLIAFDAYYAIVITIMTFCYLYVTVRIMQWRAEMRRQMVNAQRQEDAIKTDSLISYETVKYFDAEDHEFSRYRDAVSIFQDSEYHSLLAQNLMNIAQNSVFMLGLLSTCFIAAYQICIGQRDVGKFVTLLTYMAQLQSPLSSFGTFARYIQSALINCERLLELFRVQPTVVDRPSAVPLAACHGGITFENVAFSYDNRKPALNGLTFHCKPGTTIALVGESGGGKSTIFRLLFRFYDAQYGRILIDGHDIQDITIKSLRKHIGIVPQDTVLFNETLMFNLKYANQDATDKEVYEACRAASIHEKILSMPDGYQTKVGDRGLRLSGGEKQRVAIARTILKNPRIILLDEATAALDSTTEGHIQEALRTLSRGRTVLVIAHRLSTITTADDILVLEEGKVAESGKHEQLMSKNGKYAAMWQKQIRIQEEATNQVDRGGGEHA